MNNILFLFSLFYASLFVSERSWKEVKRINVEADFMTTDRLGNLYLANKNYIHLYNSNGDSIASFNSRKYGTISAVDATDPYKILVFFSDYNLVVFLDNYLSINEEIDLQKVNFDQVTSVCQAREKGIWVFDQMNQKAVHLDRAFKVTKQTVNLYQWFGKRIEPNFMLEYNNQLYIIEKETGIYIFDHFGTFKKKIPVTELESIQINNNQISYFKNGNFCNYLEKEFKENCESVKIKGVRNVRIEKNRTYLFTPKQTTIFSTN